MSFPRRSIAYVLAVVSGGLIGMSWAPAPDRGLAEAPPPPAAPLPLRLDPLPIVPVAMTRPVDPEPEPDSVPTWTVRTEESAFEEFTNVFLSVPGDAPLRCGPRRRPILMLRCLEDRTALYIAHDCRTPPLGEEGWQVDLRLDDAPARSSTMQVDAFGEAIGHWEYREARPMIESLLGATTLQVRFEDIDGLTNEMRFPVAGLARPLETLREACHWSDIPPWEADVATDAVTEPAAPDRPTADGGPPGEAGPFATTAATRNGIGLPTSD